MSEAVQLYVVFILDTATVIFLSVVQQPKSGLGCLIFHVFKSTQLDTHAHTHTHTHTQPAGSL